MIDKSAFKDCPILVTGAAGCIGAWTVKLLSEAGAVPIVYDLTENRQRLELIMKNSESVIWELGDITDFDRLQAVAEKYKIEAIIRDEMNRIGGQQFRLPCLHPKEVWERSGRWEKMGGEMFQ